jgi:hypothetical protein
LAPFLFTGESKPTATRAYVSDELTKVWYEESLRRV